MNKEEIESNIEIISNKVFRTLELDLETYGFNIKEFEPLTLVQDKGYFAKGLASINLGRKKFGEMVLVYMAPLEGTGSEVNYDFKSIKFPRGLSNRLSEEQLKNFIPRDKEGDLELMLPILSFKNLDYSYNQVDLTEFSLDKEKNLIELWGWEGKKDGFEYTLFKHRNGKIIGTPHSIVNLNPKLHQIAGFVVPNIRYPELLKSITGSYEN